MNLHEYLYGLGLDRTTHLMKLILLKIEFKAVILSNKSSLILKHYAVTKNKTPDAHQKDHK